MQELLSIVAATHSGFWVTPVDVQIAVVTIPAAGLLVGTYIQTRRHPAAELHPDSLADYAAHRLEELEEENAALLKRVARLESIEIENHRLRADVRSHLSRISGLEAKVDELTRRLDAAQ